MIFPYKKFLCLLLISCFMIFSLGGCATESRISQNHIGRVSLNTAQEELYSKSL